MIKCVRCGEMVDEAARTTCPHCLTPLAATDGAQPPHGEQSAPTPEPTMLVPGTIIGNKRVSLTGELIEINPSSQPPAYAGGSAAPPQPTPPTNGGGAGGLGVRKTAGVKGSTPAQPLSSPVAPPPPQYTAPPAATAPRPTTRPASAPMRSMESTQPKRVSNVGAIVVVLLLLVGGAGAYMFMQNRSNPKEVAEKWMRAMIKHDYTTMHELSVWKGNDIPKDVAELKSKMQTKIPAFGNMSPEDLMDMTNAQLTTVGEPIVKDGKTSIPLTIKVSMGGRERTQTQNIPMIQKNGKWRVHAASSALSGALKNPSDGGR